MRELIVYMDDDIPMWKGEEIVQCKDCKWHKTCDGEVDSWSICTEHNIRAGYVQDDDYCSWGERKAQND